MKKYSSFLLLVLSATAFADSLPREPMPGIVYEGLKEAMTAFYTNSASAADLRTNLEGLGEIREKLVFPKMDEMEFLQVSHWRDSSLTLRCWGKRSGENQCRIWMDDMVDRCLNAEKISNIQVCDFKDAIEKNYASLQDCLNSLPTGKDGLAYYQQKGNIPLLRDARGLILWSMAAGDEPEICDLLFQFAYVSAFFEDRESTNTLVALILKLQPFYWSGKYNRNASQAISRGMVLLITGSPFRDVYEQWSIAQKLYGLSDRTKELIDLVKDIEPQALAEIDPLASDSVDPAALPLDRRIEYYIDRLQETREHPTFFSGAYSLLSQCAPLIEIGTPSVSALIDHLDDRRLTRTVYTHSFMDTPGPVFRVGNVAASCIRRILNFDPLVDSTISIRPGMAVPSKDQKEKVKEWWKSSLSQKPVDWHIGMLKTASVTRRLELLKKIERLDPQAIDSIALLKEWANEMMETTVEEKAEELRQNHEANPGIRSLSETVYVHIARQSIDHERSAIAIALAERGDVSLLPQMREAFQVCADRKENAYPFVSYLTQYGDDGDFIRLFRSVLDEKKECVISDRSPIAGSIYSGVKSATHPLAVPILAEFLDCNEEKGNGSNWHGDGRFTCADRTMEILIDRTGHDEEFSPSDPMPVRQQAIGRWKQWWENTGKREYAERHPVVQKAFDSLEDQ